MNGQSDLCSLHQVLTCSYEPLRTPLLPLPYGETTSTASGRNYGTLQEESIKISTSLLPVQEPGKGSAVRYGACIPAPCLLIGLIMVVA